MVSASTRRGDFLLTKKERQLISSLRLFRAALNAAIHSHRISAGIKAEAVFEEEAYIFFNELPLPKGVTRELSDEEQTLIKFVRSAPETSMFPDADLFVSLSQHDIQFDSPKSLDLGEDVEMKDTVVVDPLTRALLLVIEEGIKTGKRKTLSGEESEEILNRLRQNSARRKTKLDKLASG